MNDLNIFNYEKLDFLLKSVYFFVLKWLILEWKVLSELFEYMEKIDELINEFLKWVKIVD